MNGLYTPAEEGQLAAKAENTIRAYTRRYFELRNKVIFKDTPDDVELYLVETILTKNLKRLGLDFNLETLSHFGGVH